MTMNQTFFVCVGFFIIFQRQKKKCHNCYFRGVSASKFGLSGNGSVMSSSLTVNLMCAISVIFALAVNNKLSKCCFGNTYKELSVRRENQSHHNLENPSL